MKLVPHAKPLLTISHVRVTILPIPPPFINTIQYVSLPSTPYFSFPFTKGKNGWSSTSTPDPSPPPTPLRRRWCQGTRKRPFSRHNPCCCNPRPSRRLAAWTRRFDAGGHAFRPGCVYSGVHHLQPHSGASNLNHWSCCSCLLNLWGIWPDSSLFAHMGL